MPKQEYPKSVQDLPKKKYDQWTSVYHSARDDGDSKETAAKKAWGAVNKNESRKTRKESRLSLKAVMAEEGWSKQKVGMGPETVQPPEKEKEEEDPAAEREMTAAQAEKLRKKDPEKFKKKTGLDPSEPVVPEHKSPKTSLQKVVLEQEDMGAELSKSAFSKEANRVVYQKAESISNQVAKIVNETADEIRQEQPEVADEIRYLPQHLLETLIEKLEEKV